jgi:ribosome maturation factor RimP
LTELQAPLAKARWEQLRLALEGALLGAGYVPSDVRWRRSHGRWLLRLTIDRPEASRGLGSVGTEDCARASRAASRELERWEPALPDGYTLEVSSPGIQEAEVPV